VTINDETMDALPYKVIKTKKQYYQYCKTLEELVVLKTKNRDQKDAVELLTLLIEKWDEDHNTFSEANPIELLRYLMEENKLRSVDMAALLGVSKSLFSDILNYRRGLSKDVIRKLSERFKVSQELFNKTYKLVTPLNARLKDASVMNTRKSLPAA
jgi:HTH-type transcriptional regulator / antitoxin HigA